MPSIAVISDIHIGHRAALWPESYDIGEGIIVSSSPEQAILREYWEDYWSRSEVNSADYIFNLAESIEGNNRKSIGRNLTTPHIDTQMEAFISLIKPHIHGRKYICVEGSLYHDSLDTNVEQIIAERLGGTFKGQVANMEIADTGKIVNIAHDPGNAMVYMSTMLDRQSLFADAVEGPWSHNKFDYHVDVMVRAHAHKFRLVQDESRLIYINPTWKFWHPIRAFGAKNYHRSQPVIGGTVLQISRRSVHVIPITYPLVHIYDAITQE